MRNLSEVHGDPVFDAQPVPTLLLDRQLTIRAVNRAYATSVRRAPEELLGMPMFEAFPDNPEDPDADGVANLHASLERTASQRKPHHMLVQRYDIKDTRRGGWLPRVWSPVNSPIVTDRGVIGLMHQVRDITPLDHDLRRVLHHYRAWGSTPRRPTPTRAGSPSTPTRSRGRSPRTRPWSPRSSTCGGR